MRKGNPLVCGIFAILQYRERAAPPEGLLQETVRLMRHRGPDGSGIHADTGIGLAHTRLSLVDLNERSNQPLWDASQRYCLVYNGELYDYSELRARLEQRGVVFRTASDTEVLLEALVNFGVEATLPQLEGMFAFALYDRQEKSLVVARDRFGIKPLYIYESDEAFAVSSTIEALKPWIKLHPDALTVSAYLQGFVGRSFGGPMSGRSFFDQVSLLPPGAIVCVEPGGRPRYSQCLTMNGLIDTNLAEAFQRRSRDQLVDIVEQRLLESVKSQLCADVPVGAFCSGGVDSSLILAMAKQSQNNLQIFHADIAGPLSERPAAQQLADHLKLDLKAVSVRDQDFVDSIPDVIEHSGFPFLNPTTVPILLVSRLVHEHGIKAVLTGEASDECFLGYDWLLPSFQSAAQRYARLTLRKLLPWQRDRDLVMGLSNRFEFAMGPAEFPAAPSVSYQAQSTRGVATDGELSHTLRTLLYRNDTMGMAASVESRFPFLDSRVVKISANLPYDCKVRFSPLELGGKHPFFCDKWIVRQVASRYVPKSLSDRPKGMFPTNAYWRFQISDKLFENSFVADWFGLARPRLRYLLSNASGPLKLRLCLLEAWGHLFIRGLNKTELSSRLSESVTVRPV